MKKGKKAEKKSAKEAKSAGKVVSKKGSCKNATGYALKDTPDEFVFTKKQTKVTGKVTKECKYPVAGNIPEGKWVVVEGKNENFFLVPADKVK